MCHRFQLDDNSYRSGRLWNISMITCIAGMDVVKKIESYGSESGKTTKKIVVANSGQL